jgi:hypothetical protein
MLLLQTRCTGTAERPFRARTNCSLTVELYRASNRRQHHCAATKQDGAADAPQDIAVSQALTAIGLSGTIAVSGAALCGINLFGLFEWQRLQDLQLAIELNTVLILLDAVLFLPNHSIPAALSVPEHQPGSTEQAEPQWQQQQLLDVSAVSELSAWKPNSWRLMLAMLHAAIRHPQLQQLPLQVTAARASSTGCSTMA